MVYQILCNASIEQMGKPFTVIGGHCNHIHLARYQVIHAPNGMIGVNVAQQTYPDLILCDIIMPELNGFGVFNNLNNDPETAKIPFIFLTAKSDYSDYRTGMNLGADDYITKPFDGIDLLNVIQMRLAKSERRKSKAEFQHLKDMENMLWALFTNLCAKEWLMHY